MSTAEQDLQELNVSIQEVEHMIALGDAFDRLRNNADFKKLILDEYLQKHAIQMIKSKSSFNLLLNEHQQKYIDNEIAAIGAFDQFLRHTSVQANQARMDLTAYRETETEIMEEAV